MPQVRRGVGPLLLELRGGEEGENERGGTGRPLGVGVFAPRAAQEAPRL